MRRLEFYASIFLMFFSLFASREAYRLSLGSPGTPGPGLVPFLLSAVLFLLTFMYFLKALFAVRREDEIHLWRGLRWKKVVLVLAILFSYAALLEKAGFLICTFLLLMSLLQFVDRQRWYWVYGGSLAITLLFYMVFKTWLKVQLPLGFLRIS